MPNAVVKSTGNTKLGFTSFMTSGTVKNKINEIIGDEKRGVKFVSSIVSAVNSNPMLKECDNASILSGALLGAIRSGQYKKLNVLAIKEGELVKYDPLNEEIEVNLIEDEELREKAPTIGYYAMFEYTNGFRKTLYWSKKKMEAHALQYSKGYQAKKGYTFWEKDFDGMAYKTMLRQLISKWGIMSIDLQNAYEGDMAYIKEDGSKEYVDNEDVTPNTTVVDAEIVDTPNVSLDEV